jgi:hypothetical protein
MNELPDYLREFVERLKHPVRVYSPSAPNRRKEDKKTKIRKKMEDRSRKINRNK